MIYVGLDLHKKTIQIAAVDYRGATLLNKKIRNTHASLEMEIPRMPKGSKYVRVLVRVGGCLSLEIMRNRS